MKRAIVYLGMILISQNLFSQEGEDNQQLQAEEPKQELPSKSSNFNISGYTEVNRHHEVNGNIARLKAE